MKAAAEEVEALISVSADSSADDLDRLLDGATRSFRQDLQSQADTFRQALRSGGVTSTGEITSTGVVSLDDDRARVLVAAEGTVTNDRTDGAEPRQYRVRVDVERVDQHRAHVRRHRLVDLEADDIAEAPARELALDRLEQVARALLDLLSHYDPNPDLRAVEVEQMAYAIASYRAEIVDDVLSRQQEFLNAFWQKQVDAAAREKGSSL